MARKKIKSATDQRKFTIIYNDFLESKLLNYYEKMIFITLKKFADNDTKRAFPSLNTIQKITGISLSQIRRSIEHMKELGVITIENRIDKEKGHQSNIYTLYDYAEIWDIGSSEDVKTIAEEISERKLVAELQAKGYTVIKEKELDTEPTKAQHQALQKNNSNFYKYNNTSDFKKSQDLENYSLEFIHTLYDYKIMIHDYPYEQGNIDAVMNILKDTLNTTLPTIRIGQEDKPTMVVISKLMKLNYSEILYVIQKYKEQTERVRNPKNYILTMLYQAKEQMDLDITNQVQHDMYNWTP